MNRKFLAILCVALVWPAGSLTDAGAAQQTPQYSPHRPIRIEGDAAFTAANGVIGGSGTASDPYIIEGWDIRAASSNGIDIRNTTASFVVRDVWVHSAFASQTGILLDNVHGSRIDNVTVSSNNWIGVTIVRSTSIAVVDSEFASNSGGGIVLDTVQDVWISDNVFLRNTGGGLRLDSSANVRVEANFFDLNYGGGLLGSGEFIAIVSNRFGNNGGGIDLISSDHVAVRANMFGTNFLGGTAVFFRGSSEVSIEDNLISTYSSGGIAMWSSHNATLRANTIVGNNFDGVYLFQTADTSVYHNNFSANYRQATDDGGVRNAWDGGYPAGGNYWSDYSGTDRCSGPNQDACPEPDGVGDTPYLIAGGATDRYPLMVPRLPADYPPVPVLEVSPRAGNVTTTFAMNASSSWDLPGSADSLQVRWDWEGDGVWDTPWSTEKEASRQFALAGTYGVRLEVKDAAGLIANATKRIFVRAVEGPPETIPIVFFIAIATAVTVAAITYAWTARRKGLKR